MRDRIGQYGLAFAIAVSVVVVAIALLWLGSWIALEAVAVAGAFAVTAASLWLLRQDRTADYYRSLVPMVVVGVGSYDASSIQIPIEVTALGSGIAFNVMVNIFPKVGETAPIVGKRHVPHLFAGQREEIFVRMVHSPFLGVLEVGYFDVDSRRHVAWRTVNYASGKLETQDPLNWDCPRGCPVHRFNRKPRP